jgi:hypothetical protein
MVNAARWLALAASLLACAPRTGIRSGAAEATVFRFGGRAQAVALRGSMTGWRAIPLERRGRSFQVALRLEPGRYEYRLEVQHGGAVEVEVWLPEGAEHVPDGFGGENAVLRIP